MQFVIQLIISHYVRVHQTILAHRMSNVACQEVNQSRRFDLNVKLIQIVRMTKRVSMKNAKIHVKKVIFVLKMPFVMYKHIDHFAYVMKAIPEMLNTLVMKVSFCSNSVLKLLKLSKIQHIYKLINLNFLVGCRSDNDCAPNESCINRNCLDTCNQVSCGLNAICKPDYNHHARCYCFDGYRGNPLIVCERPECSSNQDCPFHLACINEHCQDPCNCAPGAQCRVDNHVATCKCLPGFVGDAYVRCTTIQYLPTSQCTVDADCPSKMACFNNVCKNPCIETRPCGAHAVCSVVDSLPLRTMVCSCEPGFMGNADIGCKQGNIHNSIIKQSKIQYYLTFWCNQFIGHFTGSISNLIFSYFVHKFKATSLQFHCIIQIF